MSASPSGVSFSSSSSVCCPPPQHQLWVDKYKPLTISQMCYPVSANKLKDWLINFYDAASTGDFEPKQPRGVLLSGPPGIGKTTTVHVVAAELGLTVVEYNASDFRSKKSLHEGVADMTTNKGFALPPSSALSSCNPFPSRGSTEAKETGCFGVAPGADQRINVEENTSLLPSSCTACSGNSSVHASPRAAPRYGKMLLLMDEVDGCDIGGVGEIITMLKTTTVPIMCTCNDRWHPKLRSLLNHVEDMRLSRPPCHIVANFLYDRVLAREGVSLSKPLLQTIVQQSGSDIRSMLNNLQMWSLHKPRIEQRELASYAAGSSKNGDAGLFEAAEYFLLQGTSRGEVHTLEDMEKVYYNADLIDMFVQENYLHYNPFGVSSTEQAPSFAESQRMGGNHFVPPSTRDLKNNNSANGGKTGEIRSDSSFYALPPSSINSWLSAVQLASDAISRADAAHKVMYVEQNWSVSRAYVLLSSILPCAVTRGKYESFCSGQQAFFDRQRPVKFPSWLGHNSTARKNTRLLRCVAAQATHPLHGMSGNGEDILLDYFPLALEPRLTRPLISFPFPSSSSSSSSSIPSSCSLSTLSVDTSSVSSPPPFAPPLSPSPSFDGACASPEPEAVKGKKKSQGSLPANAEGIDEVIRTMEQYHLLRDDWDYVVNLVACFDKKGGGGGKPSGSWPSPSPHSGHYSSTTNDPRHDGNGQTCLHRYGNAMGMRKSCVSSIPTATKSAFTRAVNRKFGMTQSYLKSALRHVPGGEGTAEGDESGGGVKLSGGEEGDDEEDEEEDGTAGASSSNKKLKKEVGKEGKGPKGVTELNIPGVKLLSSTRSMGGGNTNNTNRSPAATTSKKKARSPASRKGNRDMKGKTPSSSSLSPIPSEATQAEKPKRKTAAAPVKGRGAKQSGSKASPSLTSRCIPSPKQGANASARKRSRKLLEDDSSESSVGSSTDCSSVEEDCD